MKKATLDTSESLSRKAYDKELKRLHGELVALQEWAKATGAKICVHRSSSPRAKSSSSRCRLPRWSLRPPAADRHPFHPLPLV